MEELLPVGLELLWGERWQYYWGKSIRIRINILDVKHVEKNHSPTTSADQCQPLLRSLLGTCREVHWNKDSERTDRERTLGNEYRDRRFSQNALPCTPQESSFPARAGAHNNEIAVPFAAVLNKFHER